MSKDLDRNVMPDKGAHFSRDPDGNERFSFVIDPTNIIGPRAATDEDRRVHHEAYDRFVLAALSEDDSIEEQASDMPPSEPIKRRPGRPKRA